MGLFDFLFSNKQKERERQELLRAQQEARRRAEEHRRVAEQRKQQERQRAATSLSSNSERLVEIASQCNMAHNMGNQNAAAQLCKMLYDEVSPRKQGGKALINLSADNGQCVGLAFTHMALCYNWGDEDINSVASENAFYCLAKNLIEKHNTFVAPAIFTIMQKGSKLMKDKLIASWCDMVQKQIGMPIGMALGGNPYADPKLDDFRQQAIGFKDDIAYYALTKFYDVDKEEFTIPTDMPYYIPKETEIQIFLTRVKANPAFGNDSFLKNCEEHFSSVYKQCGKTLRQY